MAKYNKGDRCKVTKNLLAPKCVGHAVVIDSIANEKDGRILYNAHIEDPNFSHFNCLCAETCLELIEDGK